MMISARNNIPTHPDQIGMLRACIQSKLELPTHLPFCPTQLCNECRLLVKHLKHDACELACECAFSSGTELLW